MSLKLVTIAYPTINDGCQPHVNYEILTEYDDIDIYLTSIIEHATQLTVIVVELEHDYIDKEYKIEYKFDYDYDTKTASIISKTLTNLDG